MNTCTNQKTPACQSSSRLQQIRHVYAAHGWKGLAQRLHAQATQVRQLGLRGIANNVAGYFVYLRTGRYSLKHAYDRNFYLDNLGDSRPMAEYMAPRLARALRIQSIIDLGCATGHWVDAFARAGVDSFGVEGGESARALLLCAPERIMFADLRTPLTLTRRFDMVMSIEVAEHIDGAYVDAYVDNMTRFTPRLIMITAAPPGQGGHYHINEQHKEYWDALFLARGYRRTPGVEQLVASFAAEARAEKNPPAIYRNPAIPHPGVFIPYWMPANLLVYSQDPAAFEKGIPA